MSKNTILQSEEVAVLYAIASHDNARSCEWIARRAAFSIATTDQILTKLVEKNILMKMDTYRGVVYGIADNETAQKIAHAIDILRESLDKL